MPKYEFESTSSSQHNFYDTLHAARANLRTSFNQRVFSSEFSNSRILTPTLRNTARETTSPRSKIPEQPSSPGIPFPLITASLELVLSRCSNEHAHIHTFTHTHTRARGQKTVAVNLSPRKYDQQ